MFCQGLLFLQRWIVALSIRLAIVRSISFIMILLNVLYAQGAIFMKGIEGINFLESSMFCFGEKGCRYRLSRQAALA
ncbi:hypothetical protein CFN79_10665 [Chromobacterium vaccinii]|uniref:Uncharacterized protein n=1 Tax=Pseudogulbenkiania ferrooxidans EGD-HP2 TaxID=1388764 RepID=A0ABN0N791_9NEIS|nr:hypothetical protein CFN79_10665 [Chromobacterium vaccinii]ERE06998.1 hypothetical protein O166_07575 [Pseudogulbenkiania ferrooxidans EGD-HP2]